MTGLRDRIIASAIRITTSTGWASVTMARLADDVGVSRQTVYNEVGPKPALAQAMVAEELGRFLAVVEEGFDAHPSDVSSAVTAASLGVLDRAHGQPLLRAIISASHGADTELLPLLTTRAAAVLVPATAVVEARLGAYPAAADPVRRRRAADALVRVVLSHVMSPQGRPEETAIDIGWLAARLLAPDQAATGASDAAPKDTENRSHQIATLASSSRSTSAGMS